MQFQEPELTFHIAFQNKSGINPFYNVRKKNVNSITETLFVIAHPCEMYGLYFVMATFDRTLFYRG